MKKTIYNRIDEAKANREAQLKELEDNRKATEQEKAEKEKAAAEILTNGSAEEYAAAKAAIRSAEDKAEYYTKRINDLTATPLFDEREKAKYTKEITDDLRKKQQEAAEIIAEAATKAADAGEVYRDAIDKVTAYYTVINGKDLSTLTEKVLINNVIRTLRGVCDAAIIKGVNKK